jgi:hypothetical protein
VTTRSKGVALRIVEENDIIMVDPMNKIHAEALFEKKVRRQANQEDTTELMEALEYMPLAIVQAAAYIKQMAPYSSVKQYLKEFRKSDHRRLSLLNHEGGQLQQDWEAKNSIILTWQISFDHIRQARPIAADLLSLMSFFDRQGIIKYLLQDQNERENSSERLEENQEDKDG